MLEVHDEQSGALGGRFSSTCTEDLVSLSGRERMKRACKLDDLPAAEFLGQLLPAHPVL